jgi:REP element-mobilizing transposase RayT
MAHTHSATFFHCVFSTKERLNSIPSDLKLKLWDYIGGIAKQNGMRSLRVGGTKNHVHIALHVPAAMTVAKAMQLIKAGSSKWLNEHPRSARFEWQEGYGAFSIGVSRLDATVAYIDAQEEHHRKRTFEEEYVSFLKRHGIEYDERYVLG